MKHLIFSGCSFTDNLESWAHMSNSSFIFDNEEDRWWFELHNTDFNTAYMGASKLSDEIYSSTVIAESSGSNTLIVRRLIHFIENCTCDVDTIIFQITGFERRELLISDQQVIKQTYTDCNGGKGVQIGDLSYIKQDGTSYLYSKVIKENPAPDYVRKTSAYFYSKIHEPEDYRVKNIDALQMLTMFCSANSIRLAYFHGWDNYPIGPSRYFNQKYEKYVKPYLLPVSNLLQYAASTLPKNKIFAPDGSHPSIFAHKKYWNDVVYPFILN